MKGDDMRLNKLDLNLLVALDVLLKEQSISRAAEKLNLSPSAVSNSLARLREYFDDDILSLVGRQMIPSPLGESLREPVRDVLHMIESSIMVQPTFEPETTDRIFKIFCSDYTQMVLLPHLLALANRLGSTARFQLLQQIQHPEKRMEQGEGDLLIIPEEFTSDSHPYSVLYEETFVCLAWQGSRIARHPLTLESYANASHVVMEPANSQPDFFSTQFESEFSLQRRIAASTYSFSALPLLVVGTENLATVHLRLAKKMAQNWPLTLMPLPISVGPMKQCLQWHHYRDNDLGLLWLRDLLHKASIVMGR
jgi:DNA-binding transcriptional LysR family regulator